jgi:hypothetical protein
VFRLGGAYISAVLGFENAPQEIQAQFRQILEVWEHRCFYWIDWWWCLGHVWAMHSALFLELSSVCFWSHTVCSFFLEPSTVCFFIGSEHSVCFWGGAYIAAVLGFENAPGEIQAQFRQILEVRRAFFVCLIGV